MGGISMKYFFRFFVASLQVISTIWGLIGISLLWLFQHTPFFGLTLAILISGYFFLFCYFVFRNRHVKMPKTLDGIAINTYPLLQSNCKLNSHLAISEINVKVKLDESDLSIEYIYEGTVHSFLPVEGLYVTFASEANMENKRIYKAFNEYDNELTVRNISPKGMSQCLFISFSNAKRNKDKFYVKITGHTSNAAPLSGTTYYFIKPSFFKINFFQTVKYSFLLSSSKKLKQVKCYQITPQTVDLIRSCQIFQTLTDYIAYDATDDLGFNNIRIYIFER